MSQSLVLSFDSFRAAKQAAAITEIKPYGIDHNGETYWSDDLPAPGTLIRCHIDESGP